MTNPIGWCQATWNPIVGCSVVSPGCKRCYAMRQAHRLAANPKTPWYAGTTECKTGGPPVWTGKIVEAPERTLLAPLRRRRPTTWFVNSMSDLFHEAIPDEWIDRVFAVMALCPQHRFQILSKRPERMREYIHAKMRNAPEWVELKGLGEIVLLPYEGGWPTFIWLGVSVEDQRRADERIPILLDTPAAVRFISAEPLLSIIHLTSIHLPSRVYPDKHGSEIECRYRMDCLRGQAGYDYGCDVFEQPDESGLTSLDLVIVGGESGPGHRPMNPDWARSIRDQCDEAGVAFWFKQMAGGETIPDDLMVRELPE